MKYTGSCHCQAVRFQFDGPAIDSGVRCNCSICRRKGAVMTPFIVAQEAIAISADDHALTSYRFASGVAQHFFCSRCGIYPFHQTLRKPGYYRINIGCLDGIDDIYGLPVEVFDGAAL